MRAVKPKPNHLPNIRHSHLLQIPCIQHQQITLPLYPIQHHRQQDSGVFLPRSVGISDKYRLTSGVAKDLPAQMGAGFDVVFNDAVEEGGFARVGHAVDEAMFVGFEGWVEGWEFRGAGFGFGEEREDF